MSLSRFKGCLVGAAVADCIGSWFEGIRVVRLQQVLANVEQRIEDGIFFINFVQASKPRGLHYISHIHILNPIKVTIMMSKIAVTQQYATTCNKCTVHVYVCSFFN